MAVISIDPTEPWSGPSMHLEAADAVVAVYFTAARASHHRAVVCPNEALAAADRLSALFMLLAGFEAFLNCWYRTVAETLEDERREKVIAVTDSERKSLREKALNLPHRAFGRPQEIDQLVAEIARYIEVRHRFMHLKHDWHSVDIDPQITITGLMDATALHVDELKLVKLMVLIRRYMKATFRLAGAAEVPHLIDRWTKPVGDWRLA